MDLRVAVLVDGSFFLQRLSFFKRKFFATKGDLTPSQVVKILTSSVKKHISADNHYNKSHHYRTYFYDAPPLDIKAHYPFPANPSDRHKQAVDFSRLPSTIHRQEILQELKKQRKVALRLGHIKHDKKWKLKSNVLDELLKGEREFSDLTNEDFSYSMRQKGVDIKLGIDISTLSQNKQVDKIVLIAGDSDFVPAAKLARTNGIDFVLDPLRNNIDPSLHEHIDGLESFDLVSLIKDVMNEEPDIIPEWWRNGSKPKSAKKRHQSRRNNRDN